MNQIPKCPRCGERYVTSKARYFCKQEGQDEMCLYCLAQVTGKRVGATGMLEGNETTPKRVPYTSEQISRAKSGCRPCAQRGR